MTRIAIVHDWLTGQRGGENVLRDVLELLPDADLFALAHVGGSVAPEIERRRPRTTWISRVPIARRSPGALLPILPRAAERLALERYDAVVSVSHCVAHGAGRGAARRVCYSLTPMRYAWDLYDLYAERASSLGPLTPIARAVGARLRDRLRAWDRAAGASLDAVACISEHVRARIAAAWERDAEVIAPPVDVAAFAAAARGIAPSERWIAVGALRPNKRLELVARAFAKLALPLDVVGDGSPRALARLARIGGPSVRVHGRVSDERLRAMVARARSLVHAASEDFGIAPIEALAAGRPCVVDGRSGAREAVIDGDAPCGVAFDEPEVGAVAEAVRELDARIDRGEYAPERLRARAERFSRSRFSREFASFLARNGGDALARAVAVPAEHAALC